MESPQQDEPPSFEIVGGAGPDAGAPYPLQVLRYLRDDARDWCRDRSWEVRLPVLIFFVYVLARSLTELEYGSFIFNGINLGFHEMGHIVFRPFGEFMTIAGGTILQCLVPLIAAVGFWKAQRDYFAVAFSLGWFSANCFNAAIYAADARGQLNLPLVSPWGQGFGADGMGDWTRMLGRLHLLEWDGTISFLWQVLGTASMLAGLALGAWLLVEMHHSRKLPPPPPPSWA